MTREWHPLKMRLFGCIQIRGQNVIAGFKPFDLSYSRDVEQYATARNTLAGNIDCAFPCPLRADLGSIKPVIHLALPKHMAECVYVGGREAMKRDRKIVCY